MVLIPVNLIKKSPTGPFCGGIFHLPRALERYPDAELFLYGRVSSYTQGKKGLKEQTNALQLAIRDIAPDRKVQITGRVETGKLSGPRKGLLAACEAARSVGGIVVAADLSRYLRSESYCRQTNWDAWPTLEEFDLLHKLTGVVTLATLERPDLKENQRHSKATKRTGKAGRPRVIDDQEASVIFDELGAFYIDSSGRWRWQRPIKEVAKEYGVKSTTLHNLADRVSPNGLTWRKAAKAKAEEMGLLGSPPPPLLPW